MKQYQLRGSNVQKHSRAQISIVPGRSTGLRTLSVEQSAPKIDFVVVTAITDNNPIRYAVMGSARVL